MSLIGTFIFVGPVPTGDKLTGDGHVAHFTVPREGHFGVHEFRVQLLNEVGEVGGLRGLEEECVVVLEEELDGEVGG